MHGQDVCTSLSVHCLQMAFSRSVVGSHGQWNVTTLMAENSVAEGLVVGARIDVFNYLKTWLNEVKSGFFRTHSALLQFYLCRGYTNIRVLPCQLQISEI